MSKLAQALKEVARRNEELYLKLCTVDSVDETERTIACTPIDDGAQLISVDLQALQEKTAGLLIVPKVGSEVLIGYLDKDNAAVLLYTEIDKIILDIENTVVVNGGENGGLCITPELKTQLKKLSKRVDGIIDAITNAIPTPQDGGAGLKTTMVAALNLLIDKEDFSKIENDKIKH
jgi:hypothetical protein